MLGGVADVTHILNAIEQGDRHAAAELLPLVYGELRQLAAARLAGESPGQTLQPTALVHEAYVRLVAGGDGAAAGDPRWDGRGHFFAAAAGLSGLSRSTAYEHWSYARAWLHHELYGP